MKKFIFLLIVACNLFSFKSYGQDVITKKDGTDIAAKVLEVNTGDIKYKKFDNQQGPTFTMLKSEILIIRYENGSKDVFPVGNSTYETKQKKEKGDPTSKSNYFISPNLAYAFALNLPDGVKVSDLSLNIDNGYFLLKNFALVTAIGLDNSHYSTSSSSSSSSYQYYTYSANGKNKIWHTGYNNSATAGESTNTILFTYGAGLRYYIAGKFFLGTSLISSTKDFDATISSAYFHVGYANFFNNHIAVESSISYIVGIGDADGSKAIQAKVGVGFYF